MADQAMPTVWMDHISSFVHDLDSSGEHHLAEEATATEGAPSLSSPESAPDPSPQREHGLSEPASHALPTTPSPRPSLDPASASTSTAAIDAHPIHLTYAQRQLIIGLSLGIGIPIFLIVTMLALCCCRSRRKEYTTRRAGKIPGEPAKLPDISEPTTPAATAATNQWQEGLCADGVVSFWSSADSYEPPGTVDPRDYYELISLRSIPKRPILGKRGADGRWTFYYEDDVQYGDVERAQKRMTQCCPV